MMNKTNSYITVEQFVTALIENFPIIHNTNDDSLFKLESPDYMHYGYHAGWLEDMDITGKNEPLLKKNAARIAHEFMRLEMHEPDSEDISAATKLRDLYDCRVCTKHIMQVVTKGIMGGYYITDSLYLFGLNDKITREELPEIIKRIFHPESRIVVKEY